MKTYRGRIIGPQKKRIVTVDGQPLAPRLDLVNLSPRGFAWGDAGPGSAQLALAILADHLADDEEALEHYQAFHHATVAALTGGDPWLMTAVEIIRALEELDLGR